MIRLIASDVDGTLVKDSAPTVNPAYFDEIRRLREKGIAFVVASGRQYHSIARMFAPVKDELIFISENGSLTRQGDEILDVVPMDQEDAAEIVRDIRSMPDTEMVVSVAEGHIVESKDQEFIALLRYGYRNQFDIVEDVLATGRTIIKVAAYKRAGIRQDARDFYLPKWKDRCLCCLAGEAWVDFMDGSAGKGYALSRIQERLGISREETMAFGDNDNDLSLIQAAAESYAVETASPALKEIAKNICPGYQSNGVLGVLRRINHV